MIMVVAFPVVFYVPKFFEYRYEKFTSEYSREINCSEFVHELNRIKMIQEIESVSLNQSTVLYLRGSLYNNTRDT